MAEESVSLISMGACGAYVHALEDEFMGTFYSYAPTDADNFLVIVLIFCPILELFYHIQ